MKATEKAESDRQRQGRAVDRALQHTSLIKGEQEFPTIDAKASYGARGDDMRRAL